MYTMWEIEIKRKEEANNGVIDLKRKMSMGKTWVEKVVFGFIPTIAIP